MPSSRPEIRFLDILDNIRLIQSYVEGMDRVAFDAIAGPVTRWNAASSASAKRQPNLACRPMNLGLPWVAVRAFGNVLRHAYDQVDPARIWEIITVDLTPMAEAAGVALLRLEKARKP